MRTDNVELTHWKWQRT